MYALCRSVSVRLGVAGVMMHGVELGCRSIAIYVAQVILTLTNEERRGKEREWPHLMFETSPPRARRICKTNLSKEIEYTTLL